MSLFLVEYSTNIERFDILYWTSNFDMWWWFNIKNWNV